MSVAMQSNSKINTVFILIERKHKNNNNSNFCAIFGQGRQSLH